MAYRSCLNSHHRAVYKHHNYRSSPSTAASQHFFCLLSFCLRRKLRPGTRGTLQEGALPKIDLHDEVTPFECGAPGLRDSRKDKTVQYEHNPYFVTGPASAIAPSARFMNPPSH